MEAAQSLTSPDQLLVASRMLPGRNATPAAHGPPSRTPLSSQVFRSQTYSRIVPSPLVAARNWPVELNATDLHSRFQPLILASRSRPGQVQSWTSPGWPTGLPGVPLE